MCPVRPRRTVLALGSPHGDDQVAWHVVDRLADTKEFQVAAVKIASPFEIAAHVDAGLDMIVIDACRFGAAPGTVLRFEEHDLERLQLGVASTHGGSLTEGLQLAKALGRRPARLTVLAVEIESSFPNGDSIQVCRDCEEELWRHLCAELSDRDRACGIADAGHSRA